jgi:RuvB-like protein 1 (pontin 52)
LDRLLIIRTLPYTIDEIKVIVRIRAKTEGLTIEEPAVDYISENGIKTSLRFAIQLLSPANILADINGREAITLEDVQEVDDLFFDAKRSAKNLAEHENQFIL